MIIEEYNEFNAKIAEVQQAANFIPDVTTDEGYQKSKRVALDVGKILTSLEKKRKEKKEFFLNGGKEVDRQAKEIAQELESFQLPHKEAYKELDNLKKEREAKRKAELELRVANMRELPELMRDSDSGAIKAALEHLMEEECLDFYEFTEHALKARNSARSELSELYKNVLKSEAEAVELEKLRKEKAEREQKEREELIAKEAAEEARKAEEAKRIESEKKARLEAEAAAQREADAKAALKKAEDDRIAAEAKAKQDAIDAEERQKAAVTAAEEKAKQDAIDKRLAEEAAAKAREADEKHKSKINNSALMAMMKAGVTEKQAKAIIIMIHNGQVPNVTISY